LNRDVGKRFEQDFAKSMPEGAYYHRLKDPATSFGGGQFTRFALSNPCDCFVYFYPNFYAFELKTTTAPLTFWRKADDLSVVKRTYNIRKNQIEGLLKVAETPGGIAGLVINFRPQNETYFVDIKRFVEVTDHMAKRSVNRTDISSIGILIPQELIRVRWRYDIGHLFNRTAVNPLALAMGI